MIYLQATLLVICISFQLSNSCHKPKPATTLAPTTTCDCGRKNRNRIVGGTATLENEFPWQVALVPAPGERLFCGGSLISTKSVLTAAQCRYIEGYTQDFKVILAKHYRDTAGKSYSYSSWIEHPLYNQNTQDNDFAIITLSESIKFTDNIRPVCLPSLSTQTGKAVVTGWGRVFDGGNYPRQL